MIFALRTLTPLRSASLQSVFLDLLTPLYADEDYRAVCASADAIRGTFGPGDEAWPSPHITYEENLADLVRHEREFHERYAFAYVVLDHTKQKYLGCVYLKPIKTKQFRNQQQAQFSAQAFLWLSTLHNVLDVELIRLEIAEWFERVWGLPHVAWPGRTTSWSVWQQLASQSA